MPKITNWSPNHERGNLKRNWTHDQHPVHVGIMAKKTLYEDKETYYRVYFEDRDLIISETIAERDNLDDAVDEATDWLRDNPLHNYEPSFEQTVMEESTGHITDEEEEMIKQDFNWVVVDAQDTSMSFGEAYLGTGLGTVNDYGRHHDLSEQELIEKVKDNFGFEQYLNFKTDGEVADTIVILSRDDGYVKTVAKMENLKEEGLA